MSENDYDEVINKEETRYIPLKNECIKTQKVYDWIRTGTEDTKEVSLTGTGCIAAIEAALAQGKQINIECEADQASATAQVVSLIRKTIKFKGKKVEVGCLQILKSFQATFTVFADDNSEPICTPFTRTIQLLEKAAVCFPPGLTIEDNIVIEPSRVDCLVLTEVPVDGNILVDVIFCQDIQVEVEVKLKIQGEFCEPRPNDVTCEEELVCPEPEFPEQCPVIFPRDC